MPFNIKKGWIIAISVALILVTLNPSYSDFKEFTGKEKSPYITKDLNFVFFSVYRDHERKYVAFLKNFIYIPPPPPPNNKPTIIPQTDVQKIVLDTNEDGLPIFHK